MIAAALVGGLLVAQLVAARTVRDALFLSSYPIASLPGIMLASALVSVGGAFAFASALARRPPTAVLTGALLLQGALFMGEWAIARQGPRLSATAVYLQVALLGPGLLSGFWSLVSERFDPHTARRVVGPIGAGASAGGVVGGALAWSGARVLPVPTLLVGLAAMSLLVMLVMRGMRAVRPREEPSGEGIGGVLAGLHTIRRFPYLRQLASIVAIGAVAEVLLDYLLRADAARALSGGAELARFFGIFHGGVAVLTLAVQATATRPALARWGLSGTASFHPAVVAAASTVGLVFPSVLAAAATRGLSGGLRDSLFRSSYELFYTPLPPWQKRRTKALVDVAADKLGVLAGAGLVILLAAQPSFSDRWLWAIVLAATLGSVALARQLDRGYVSALEHSLRSGLVSLEADEVQDVTTRLTLTRNALDRESLLAEIRAMHGGARPSSPEDPRERLARDLGSGQPERIRVALVDLESRDPEIAPLLVPLLARDDVLPHVLRALRRIAPRIVDRLIDALVDPDQPEAVRRRIPRVLKATPTPRTVEGLLRGLDDPELGVRRSCGAVLGWMRRAGVAVPAAGVYAALARELERPVKDAEGQLDHVFILLAAVGEAEPLRASRWAVSGHDARLRGTALEYLDQVLPEAVRGPLLRRLGATWSPPVRPRAIDEVEDELRQSSVSLPRGRRGPAA